MILVISNIANEAAPALVEKFPKGAASLITASEFNKSFKAGIPVNDFTSSLITIKNRQIPAQEISGIVSTIPYFLSQEFYYIEAADRDYVCAEMNAFFIYFLSAIRCKKLNPPSAKSLTGLSMHKFEWLNTITGLKIPVWPFAYKNGVLLKSENEGSHRFVTYTLIGHAFTDDSVPEKIAAYMRTIANYLHLPYLSCVFVDPGDNNYFLWDIASVPNIDTETNREAIVNYFLKSA